MNSIVRYLICFFIYSFIGWLWETILFTVREKRLVNRGFLFGPLCPIYGVGAVFCILAMYNRVDKWWLIFIIGLIACTLLEYFTHYMLEKLFHATWWDYRKAILKINGRNCISSSLAFGACVTLLIKAVHPAVERIIGYVSRYAVNAAAFIFYTRFYSRYNPYRIGHGSAYNRLLKIPAVYRGARAARNQLYGGKKCRHSPKGYKETSTPREIIAKIILVNSGKNHKNIFADAFK